MSHAILVVRTLVFPEPAPAKMRDDEDGNVVASSCSLFKPSKMEFINFSFWLVQTSYQSSMIRYHVVTFQSGAIGYFASQRAGLLL